MGIVRGWVGLDDIVVKALRGRVLQGILLPLLIRLCFLLRVICVLIVQSSNWIFMSSLSLCLLGNKYLRVWGTWVGFGFRGWSLSSLLLGAIRVHSS